LKVALDGSVCHKTYHKAAFCGIITIRNKLQIVLFSITYTGQNASDLGYLLYKNPARPQTAEFNFGKAHVFYTEITAERCTAALLLEMDPLDLVRGRQGSAGGQFALFDYVNDRPYVSSSFMSTAISRMYGTAMSGRCDARQALADSALELSAEITMLPCRSSTSMLERVFAPLGYTVAWSEGLLDERFPEWGQGPYVNLRITGKVRLRDLLRHIYVLIPVFDFRKHYWVDDAEVDKLMSHGEGWLENHPEKIFITQRYFKRLPSLSRMALERLESACLDTEDAAESPPPEPVLRLNTQRLCAVLAELKTCNAQKVIDLGCGEGHLLRLLVKEKQFSAIAGVDVSPTALSRAAEKLNLREQMEQLNENQKKRVTLFQSSLCCHDRRFKGYDAAAIVEVIEHLDANRLAAFAASVFGEAAPKTVILTTPNAEYNAAYNIPEGKFRHSDHRFEWNRAQFRAWAETVASQYGYALRIEGIGAEDEMRGGPCQMGVFTK
jgi:3' terminal RNA ribose 2'-O-methyltransferase Hen1